MPMTDLVTETVDPIATIGNNRRQFLLNELSLANNPHLVLVSMGGIKTDIYTEAWPHIKDVHYLIDGPVPENRNDISSLSNINISFIDALNSVDLFITKPGYGSFSQAACNRTAVLYVERPDWPEHHALCDWLINQIPCASITQQQFCSGQFAQQILSLLQQPISPILPSMGLDSAINIIVNRFNL
jgi:hypothetical protein